MLVKDIMTKNPVAFSTGDTLETVLKTMKKNNITGCPVINSKNHVIGLVSQTDVIKLVDIFGKINTEEFSSFIASFVRGKIDMKKLRKVRVGDFYTKKAVTIEAESGLYDVIKLMDKKDIERLPVVRNRKLVGIITRKDIVNALEKMQD